MESSGSRTRTAFLTTLGVLTGVAVVAIASGGSIRTGEGGARGPMQALLDVLFTLYLLMILGGAALLVYLLVLRRRLEAGGGAATRRRPLETIVSLLVLAGAGSLLARQLAGHDPVAPPEAPEGVGRGRPLIPTTSADTVAYEPGIAWLPAGVTVAAIALALGAWWYAGRARRRARGELVREDLFAEKFAAAVDESLDDLRAEPDPRRAVIAAYARLERVLSGHRLPRRPAEAPLEYLARMLAELSVSPDAARRLTTLFERAKFSQHAVGPEMKEAAIAALDTVRDDLLAARALAEQERERLIAARRERAAT